MTPKHAKEAPKIVKIPRVPAPHPEMKPMTHLKKGGTLWCIQHKDPSVALLPLLFPFQAWILGQHCCLMEHYQTHQQSLDWKNPVSTASAPLNVVVSALHYVYMFTSACLLMCICACFCLTMLVWIVHPCVWTSKIACDYSLVSLVVHYLLWLFMMTHDYSWLFTFSVHDHWWSSTSIYDCLWLLVNIQYLWLFYIWLFNGILALYISIYIYIYIGICIVMLVLDDLKHLKAFWHLPRTQQSSIFNRSQPSNDLDSAWPFGTASARNGRLLSYLSSPLQHMMGAILIG